MWQHGPVGSRTTTDGEVWTTVTERENDVAAQYTETGIVATKYIIMIDKDGPAWPHMKLNQGIHRIDLTSFYFVVDAAANTEGSISVGVISRIDETNGDIIYFIGIPFEAKVESLIVSLRGVPSQVKVDVHDGELSHIITNLNETNVAAVNTGVLLNSPAGVASVVPDLGDIIMKLTYDSGTAYNVGAFLFYHAHTDASVH